MPRNGIIDRCTGKSQTRQGSTCIPYGWLTTLPLRDKNGATSFSPGRSELPLTAPTTKYRLRGNMTNPPAWPALAARLSIVLLFALAPLASTPAIAQDEPLTQHNVLGPAGSNSFGKWVYPLSNGNFVVVDPEYEATPYDILAVHLYNGETLAKISTLTVPTPNNFLGTSPVFPLSNGNFLVKSPDWDNGSIDGAGALTFVNGITGLDGTVSAENSLVGTVAKSFVGGGKVVELANGNYVALTPVPSYAGDFPGAATWGSGTTGVTGGISTANSLVGASAKDGAGAFDVVALSNGNYVISMPAWDNPGTATGASGNGAAPIVDAGIVIWGNGATGRTGEISAASGIVGTVAQALVGSGGVQELANSKYAIASPSWDDGGPANIGAVTLGNSATGTVGEVSAANSLHGTQAEDKVGSGGVIALSNGNYVVHSPFWDNGTVMDVGAATWMNGANPATGAVSAANSLVGSQALDGRYEFGDETGRVVALSNGNYVVANPYWNNGAATDVGAVTWADGATGKFGAISTSNSLHGTTMGDTVGRPVVTALTNGNYVVASEAWDPPDIANAGAATWGNGASGIVGPVSAANSLIGAAPGDLVGRDGVIALKNGNYVVASSYFDMGGKNEAGAVTWGNGATGIKGTVTTTNSLFGSTEQDRVGKLVRSLDNGNYVVLSNDWNNGPIQ